MNNQLLQILTSDNEGVYYWSKQIDKEYYQKQYIVKFDNKLLDKEEQIHHLIYKYRQSLKNRYKKEE